MSAIQRRNAPCNRITQYLIHGEFCVDEDSGGCGDIRWLSIAEMKDSGYESSEIQDKILEWEATLEELLAMMSSDDCS